MVNQGYQATLHFSNFILKYKVNMNILIETLIFNISMYNSRHLIFICSNFASFFRFSQLGLERAKKAANRSVKANSMT